MTTFLPKSRLVALRTPILWPDLARKASGQIFGDTFLRASSPFVLALFLSKSRRPAFGRPPDDTRRPVFGRRPVHFRRPHHHHVHTYIHSFINTYMHTRVHTYIHAFICIYARVHTCIRQTNKQIDKRTYLCLSSSLCTGTVAGWAASRF